MTGIIPSGLFVFALLLGVAACNSSDNQSRPTANNDAAGSPVTSRTSSHTSASPDETNGMPKTSAGAASAPYDLQFIDTMSEHHSSAITMAKIAVEKAQYPELKAFARKVIAAQQKENEQMKSWRAGWYKESPPALNMELPGMEGSMMGMEGLQGATGREFDLMFIEMMMPHHAGAVTMAKDAASRAEHSEIKNLAGKIILDQQREIEQMRQWKAILAR
jgi:uncharacterized protein (DUF305 family)